MNSPPVIQFRLRLLRCIVRCLLPVLLAAAHCRAQETQPNEPEKAVAAPAGLAAAAADLQSPNSWIRMRGLSRLDTPAAIRHAPRVAALLGDPDPLMVARAAEVLGAMGGKAFVDRIAQLLTSRELAVQSAVMRSLHALGDERCADAAVALLRSLDPPSTTDAIEARRAREQVLETIRKFGRSELGPQLAALLAGESMETRQTALTALGAIRARDQAPEVARGSWGC
jgi:HEAT repeat protein